MEFVRWLFACFLILPCFAADWTEYRSGPFHVISNAGDSAARERLNELEQFRHAFGWAIGKQDLKTFWPIQLVLFKNQREAGPFLQKSVFYEGGSALISVWSADTAFPPDWRRALARLLLDANARRMPARTEEGLLDLFSTLEVKATRIWIGAPVANRTREWARLHLIATSEEFAGRMRIFLSNLEQGADDDVALRNAYEKPAAEIWKLADAHLAGGNFGTAPVSGRPLDVKKDFVELPVIPDAILAELKSRNPAPTSPRALLAKNTREALLEAARANPNWAEPHFKLAALAHGARKIEDLKKAASLEPRNAAYWRALAEAQTEVNLYVDAAKSWAGAERAAINDEERAGIRQYRRDLDARRAEFEAAEKRRIAAEEAAELQRIKDAAIAEVRAAEAAANKRLEASATVPKPVQPAQWWEDPKGNTTVTGTLVRADCLNGPLRLVVQTAPGKTSPVLIPRISDVVFRSTAGASASIACGPQRPARKIVVHYNTRVDKKLGTLGDAVLVEFP